MRIRFQWTWLLTLLPAAAFAVLALNLPLVQPLDEAVSLMVQGWRSSPLTAMMKVFSQLAHPIVLVVFSFVLVFAVRQRKHWAPIFTNLAISVMLNLSLKEVFARPRPMVVSRLVLERGFSFPSGHSMAAAAFYGFSIYLIRRSNLSRAAKRTLSLICLLAIGLVGFSRIYLGVHYLTDVLAGYLISAVYLAIFTGFVSAYFYEDSSLSDRLYGAGARGGLVQSFAHAIDGIISGLKAERNMVIHFAAMALVTVFALVLQCSKLEWCVLIVLFAMVISAELMNTALEAAVNLTSPEHQPLAKLAKDTAAGAVLVTATAAFIVGMIIFVPKTWSLIQRAIL